MESKKGSVFTTIISYILVAALASAITYFTLEGSRERSKLEELERLIKTCYIGEVDDTQLEDGAAAGMVAGTGDRWSYYIPKSEFGSYMEQMNNEYVGVGVTVSQTEDPRGYKVLQVEAGSGAMEAGVLPGLHSLPSLSGQWPGKWCMRRRRFCAGFPCSHRNRDAHRYPCIVYGYRCLWSK
jgi:hypothetical protein